MQLDDVAKSFKKIQAYLYELTGIHLENNSKQTMMKNRLDSLTRNAVFGEVQTVQDILDIASQNAQARQLFINAFTTNKTDFFRERVHFQDMLDRAMPTLFQSHFKIKIYCAASSTGEEPYSIAATALYAKEIYRSSSDIEIIATDIDTKVLQAAKDGVFNFNPRLHLPNWVNMDKYFDTISENPNGTLQIRAKPELKSILKFQNLNLFAEKYPFNKNDFDIIFCRNILIYFKIEDQEMILKRLFTHLKIGGVFYLGHAEDLLGLKDKVERLGNKTYIKIRE
ncbi:CheR family methyltransferase [Helicobacter sp. T3_23-1056]